MTGELPLFTHWYSVTGLVLERAARFPKGLRPTLGARLIDRTLDVMEAIVALRYARERERLFRDANQTLERLRILVRLGHDRHALSTKQYEGLARDIDACGRMLGGWRRAKRTPVVGAGQGSEASGRAPHGRGNPARPPADAPAPGPS